METVKIKTPWQNYIILVIGIACVIAPFVRDWHPAIKFVLFPCLAFFIILIGFICILPYKKYRANAKHVIGDGSDIIHWEMDKNVWKKTLKIIDKDGFKAKIIAVSIFTVLFSVAFIIIRTPDFPQFERTAKIVCVCLEMLILFVFLLGIRGERLVDPKVIISHRGVYYNQKAFVWDKMDMTFQKKRLTVIDGITFMDVETIEDVMGSPRLQSFLLPVHPGFEEEVKKLYRSLSAEEWSE